jgi:hypothetical protein
MGRWVRRVLGAVAVLLLIGFVAIVWTQRLRFPLEGPDGTVEAGDEITIRAPGETCGPLLVSIWRPSILGQWNQTHSGNAIDDSFSPDERSWWTVWRRYAYFSPVPCAFDGEMTFTLPGDLEPGAIAVCDMDSRCAHVEIAAA